MYIYQYKYIIYKYESPKCMKQKIIKITYDVKTRCSSRYLVNNQILKLLVQ